MALQQRSTQRMKMHFDRACLLDTIGLQPPNKKLEQDAAKIVGLCLGLSYTPVTNHARLEHQLNEKFSKTVLHEMAGSAPQHRLKDLPLFVHMENSPPAPTAPTMKMMPAHVVPYAGLQNLP